MIGLEAERRRRRRRVRGTQQRRQLAGWLGRRRLVSLFASQLDLLEREAMQHEVVVEKNRHHDLEPAAR